MSITTNLHGRLRNTSLPASNGLLPLFEAVANSIHAIEDANLAPGEGEITVEIIRDGQSDMVQGNSQKSRGPDAKSAISGFKIRDNGVGFTDENMNSFHELDSEYKASRGGRGVGRLLWLKAFDQALIESVYELEAGMQRRRKFAFNARQGVSDPVVEDVADRSRETEIQLVGFAKRYREATPKSANIIARDLFEHCLWYFIREGGAPTVKLIDQGEFVLLDDVYHAHMIGKAKSEPLLVRNTQFELLHLRLSASSQRNHSVAFCAANRLVIQESIKGKIAGLHGILRDEQREFIYECYVSSPLLDKRVRSERTSFDIHEEPTEMFETVELSLREIREAVLMSSEVYLQPYLEEKRRLGKNRVSDFVAKKAPRYRPILDRITDEELAVDPEINDKDLELLLHGKLAEFENRLLADGHDIVNPKKNETHEDYKARLQEYLKAAADLKASDLANYVAHRKIILELLEKAVRRKDDGKYVREGLIHNLIMPMGVTSDEIHFDTCNLWLIDERLAFHEFLASDKTLASMPITDSTETKEPDLIAFNVYDTPILVSEKENVPLGSIVVVELKKPMRNDASAGEEKDPIEQALGYLERIRSGKVTTQSGRPIPKCDDIPGFCYAICDITPTVEKRCMLLGLTPTHDHLGYFGYNPNYKSYLEVISFDRLINSAKERNKAFFDKLGLPTT